MTIKLPLDLASEISKLRRDRKLVNEAQGSLELYLTLFLGCLPEVEIMVLPCGL